jgi:hypothetical protein
MRKMFQLFLIVAGYIMLTSAFHVVDPKPARGAGISASNVARPLAVRKTHRLNFFQRMLVRHYLRKHAIKNSANPDKLASTSLTLGIIACGCLLLGLFVPGVIFATIPAGIAAMITGGAAVRQKTSAEGKARTGKGLGLGALITVGLILLLAAIVIAAWEFEL